MEDLLVLLFILGYMFVGIFAGHKVISYFEERWSLLCRGHSDYLNDNLFTFDHLVTVICLTMSIFLWPIALGVMGLWKGGERIFRKKADC